MTTPLDEITGNVFRSQAILMLVNEAMADGNLTLDHVGSKAPRFDNEHGPFGPIGEDEFAAAVAIVQPVEFSAVETTGDDIAEALHTPVPESVEQPSMTRDEANAELNARNNELHLARLDRTKADEAVRRARDTLSKSLTAWNAVGPSKEAIRRREIAAINGDRAARAAQGPVPAPRVLRSRIDAEAAYATGGDAATFVRSQMKYGSFHRPARITADDRAPLQRPGKRNLIVPSER